MSHECCLTEKAEKMCSSKMCSSTIYKYVGQQPLLSWAAACRSYFLIPLPTFLFDLTFLLTFSVIRLYSIILYILHFFSIAFVLILLFFVIFSQQCYNILSYLGHIANQEPKYHHFIILWRKQPQFMVFTSHTTERI